MHCKPALRRRHRPPPIPAPLWKALSILHLHGFRRIDCCPLFCCQAHYECQGRTVEAAGAPTPFDRLAIASLQREYFNMSCAGSGLLRRQAAAVLASCLLAAAACGGPAAAQAQPVKSVKDLKAALYTDMPMDRGGDACIRLLTTNGTVGCAAAGLAPVEGPLRRLDALLPAAEDYPGGGCRCGGCGWWMPLFDAFLSGCMNGGVQACPKHCLLCGSLDSSPAPATAIGPAAAAALQRRQCTCCPPPS